MAAVTAMNGGENSPKPGTIGMLETLDRRCKEKDIVDGINGCPKLKSKVFPEIYKNDLKKYESSSENMLRSIAVYYRKGVMGKDKYRLVYKDNSFRQQPGGKQACSRIKVANCPSPRLFLYHRLMSYIKSIDTSQLYSVRENLCDGLDECDMVNGCYRSSGKVR